MEARSLDTSRAAAPYWDVPGGRLLETIRLLAVLSLAAAGAYAADGSDPAAAPSEGPATAPAQLIPSPASPSASPVRSIRGPGRADGDVLSGAGPAGGGALFLPRPDAALPSSGVDSLDPGRIRTTLEEAKGHLRSGQWAGALMGAARVLAADPRNQEAQQVRAEARIGNGDLALAQEEALELLKEEASNVVALRTLAEVKFRQGDPAAAVQPLDRVLAERPQDAQAHRFMAALRDALGQREAALAAMDRAAKLEPRYAESLKRAAAGGKIEYPEPGEGVPVQAQAPAKEAPPSRWPLFAMGAVAALAPAVVAAVILVRRRGFSLSAILAGLRSGSNAPSYSPARVLARYPDGERVLAKDAAGKEALLERRQTAGDPARRAALAGAGRALKGVSHPALPLVREILEEPAAIAVAFEWDPGKTARDLMASAGRLPLRQVAHMLRGVGEALELAHSKGVAHGRLGPEALVMDARGVTRLFGLGSAGSEEARREDVRGLAACAYELATGSKPPLQGPVHPPSAVVPGLPVEFDALIHEAMETIAGGALTPARFVERLTASAAAPR